MLILLASTTLVVATALLLSSRLAEGSVTQLLVGAYTIAFFEIVLVSLLLSLASALRQSILLASVGAVFCGALASAYRGRLPQLHKAADRVFETLRTPTVAVLALVVVAVMSYAVALALFTPANDQDALEYHLARAAFWKQQEAIRYIPGALDARLNGFPANAEIGMAFTMVASRSARFAPLVQLVAAVATAVAVYGISRRIGLSVREGLFGALLFLSLPVVALQSGTALNDIVVASFVCCSAFFLLRATSWSLVLAAIAIALLVGTKLTGILALPGLGLIAVLARRGQRPLRALTVLAIAAAIGAYWYWVNLVRVGNPFGRIAEQRVPLDAIAAISRVVRLGLDTIELPGAVGLDGLLYVGAAALLAAFAFVTPGSWRVRGTRATIAAVATLAPLALVPSGHLLLHASQKFFFEIGRTDVGYLDSQRSSTKASPIFSWYGPLGVLLTVFSCVLVFRAVRRREMPAAALPLSIAPVVWIILVGIAIPYFEWNGRFTMGGFALATATWGVVLRLPPLAWGAAALAAVTALLAFVHLHDKPSGLRLLEPTAERSVWSEPRWTVQATDHPDLRALYRFVDQKVPSTARLSLEPWRFPGESNENRRLPAFPFFGPSLSRTIIFADSISHAQDAKVDWAILRSDQTGACARGWKSVFRQYGWVVLRRAPGSRCR